jgi:hypothetical protein
MLLPMPLAWPKITLMGVALTRFVLLFPAHAVRGFYALELPHGELWITLLIAALAAAALVGFWVISRWTGRHSTDVGGKL